MQPIDSVTNCYLPTPETDPAVIRRSIEDAIDAAVAEFLELFPYELIPHAISMMACVCLWLVERHLKGINHATKTNVKASCRNGAPRW